MSDAVGASSMETTVSVVMSVYNGARFLDEVIHSIRDQTYRNFEFVIIDDGSADATPEILARHAAADSRIRLLSQPNRGLIDSLQRGFAAATGKYIARMDADDVAKPYRLEMQLEFLNSNPTIALVGGAIEIIDSESKVLATVRSPSHPEELRRELREFGNAVAHPTVMFRRRALEEVGGFRRAYQYAEDYDLWLRMAEKFDLANLQEVLLSYRRHEGAVSHQHIKQQALSALCARTTAKLRIQGRPDPTSEMDLITETVLRDLGVTQQRINEAILRNIRLQIEDAIRSGRSSAAANFVRMARPHAPANEVACASLELNSKAANAAVPASEKRKHRLMLLMADPATYWELFKPGTKYSDRQPIGL
jgi:Glycosyl transferase family 2